MMSRLDIWKESLQPALPWHDGCLIMNFRILLHMGFYIGPRRRITMWEQWYRTNWDPKMCHL